MPTTAESRARAVVRIELPQALYESYESLAGDAPPDALIAESLARALEWVGAKYAIDAASDHAIRSMLGARTDSAPKLIEMLRRLTSVHVGGIRIELRTATQEQIYWACRSAGKIDAQNKPDPAYAADLIARAIAEKYPS
jgi:hypothetical protein